MVPGKIEGVILVEGSHIHLRRRDAEMLVIQSSREGSAPSSGSTCSLSIHSRMRAFVVIGNIFLLASFHVRHKILSRAERYALCTPKILLPDTFFFLNYDMESDRNR